MAEVSSDKCINTKTINEATINAVLTAARPDASTELSKLSSVSAPSIGADLLLCDYVKLRKVNTGTRKTITTKSDEKLKVSNNVLYQII